MAGAAQLQRVFKETKGYFVKALLDWCVDNGVFSPYELIRPRWKSQALTRAY